MIEVFCRNPRQKASQFQSLPCAWYVAGGCKPSWHMHKPTKACCQSREPRLVILQRNPLYPARQPRMAINAGWAHQEVFCTLIKITVGVVQIGAPETSSITPDLGDSHHSSSRQNAALIPADPCF